MNEAEIIATFKETNAIARYKIARERARAADATTGAPSNGRRNLVPARRSAAPSSLALWRVAGSALLLGVELGAVVVVAIAESARRAIHG